MVALGAEIASVASLKTQHSPPCGSSWIGNNIVFDASQKRRWTSEDLRVMATLEVEIISKNPKAFVNKELVKVIENRSLDSI